jgi:DNA polymerase
MSLALDDRQRAMLLEMGVRVWLPDLTAAKAPAAPVQARPVATVATVATVTADTSPVRPMPPPADTSTAKPVPQPPQRPPMPLAKPATQVIQSPLQPLVSGEPLALAPLDWEALQTRAASCQACALCAGRKNSSLQPPTNAGQADWMVVGEPPDEDEDRTGSPFVEHTGLLLDNMLKAVGVRRTGVGAQGAYLSNVVKCRPPLGRLPQAAELGTCAAYLQREIELVQPKVILAMGRFALQTLLTDYPEHAAMPLGKQRGTVYQYAGVPVVVTYHPKVLLRASADKAKAWADLCLAVQVVRGSVRPIQSTT